MSASPGEIQNWHPPGVGDKNNKRKIEKGPLTKYQSHVCSISNCQHK